MVKKYVCMMEGCDFVTEDEEMAHDHADMGEDHVMVILEMKNHTIRCELLHAIEKEEIESEYEEGA